MQICSVTDLFITITGRHWRMASSIHRQTMRRCKSALITVKHCLGPTTTWTLTSSFSSRGNVKRAAFTKYLSFSNDIRTCCLRVSRPIINPPGRQGDGPAEWKIEGRLVVLLLQSIKSDMDPLLACDSTLWSGTLLPDHNLRTKLFLTETAYTETTIFQARHTKCEPPFVYFTGFKTQPSELTSGMPYRPISVVRSSSHTSRQTDHIQVHQHQRLWRSPGSEQYFTRGVRHEGRISRPYTSHPLRRACIDGANSLR